MKFKRPNLLSRFYGIIKTPKKYQWDRMPPVEYTDKIKLNQIDDNGFSLSGLNEVDMRHQGRLKNALVRHAPKDTGALSRNYNVFTLEVSTGNWSLVIYNRMWYFKFAWHYYRGEIKQNQSFIRDFVKDAVDEIMGDILKGAKLPPATPKQKVKEKQKPVLPPTPEPKGSKIPLPGVAVLIKKIRGKKEKPKK